MHLGETSNILKRGGIGVLPTDTLYGVVGSALRRKTVERIYKLRKRNPKKPFIVLIGSMLDVRRFGVALDSQTLGVLRTLWPGPVSIILPVKTKKLAYLHRGTKTIAFRLPRPKALRRLLKKTGPLVAPSANPEGKPPALTVAEARAYFGENVDFYVAGGRRDVPPSTLIELRDGRVVVLRAGALSQRAQKMLQ
ncbi:MAG: L-threonylcarbamoyladenylate synthase [Patescibacteria group bacterium]